MSDALNFAELDAQKVELLPNRTVLSCYGGSFGQDNGDHGDYGQDSHDSGSDQSGDSGQGSGSDHGSDGHSSATAINYNYNTAVNRTEVDSVLGLLGLGGGVAPTA
ncbi:MAG: hypothetical protein ACRDSP_20665 [Pseudonocardiaceae bacterium]